MLGYNKLEKGLRIIINNEPYEILSAEPLFKGRGHSVLKSKIKNLINNNVLSYTFRPSDNFLEAEIAKVNLKFLYSHRGKYFFSASDNPAQRINLNEKQIGSKVKFLKENQIIQGIVFNDKIINIALPIKIHLKVMESPPGIKGGRETPGTKTVVLETGATINVPLFIKENDIIEINTETEEYTRRV